MQDKTVVRTLVRDVLKVEAPDEIELIDSYSPDDSLHGATSKGPQGMGMETGIALLLPIIYKFFDKYLERLASRLADGTMDAAKQWLMRTDEVVDSEVINDIQTQLLEAGLAEAQSISISHTVLDALKKRRASINI